MFDLFPQFVLRFGAWQVFFRCFCEASDGMFTVNPATRVILYDNSMVPLHLAHSLSMTIAFLPPRAIINIMAVRRHLPLAGNRENDK